MNTWKAAVIFTAGMGCGILATRSYFARKYKEIADEEIKAMETVMQKRTEKQEEEPKNNDESAAPEVYSSSLDGWKGRKEELVNYNKQTESYISSVPTTTSAIQSRLDELEKKMAEQEHPSEDNADEQYEITSMDWLDDGMYDKVILTYFVGDDTVVNEAGMIDDVDMSIGMEQFEIFKSREDYEMYIRNPNLGIDYNIVKDPGCYHE